MPAFGLPGGAVPPDTLTIAIRVKPGSSRTAVGGSWGDPPRLVVAVAARAVDGAATQAALDALAEAMGVRPRHVTLVTGATSRDKVVRVEAAGVAVGELRARVAALSS